MDNDGAIVAEMLITGTVVLLAEGWLSDVKSFLVSKSSGTAYQSSSNKSWVTWALGLGVTTFVLLAAADTSENGKGLARAFGGAILAGVLLVPDSTGQSKGEEAYANLKALFGIGAGTSSSSTSSSSTNNGLAANQIDTGGFGVVEVPNGTAQTSVSSSNSQVNSLGQAGNPF